MSEMNLLIAGDLSPVGKNEVPLSDSSAESIILKKNPEIIRQNDFFIANLESPLCSGSIGKKRLMKTGPVLYCTRNILPGLKKAGISMLSLANNHIMDAGKKGLEHTLETGMSCGMEFVGAGKNIEEAEKIAIIRKGSLRVGIMAVAEKEFSYAESKCPGASPADLIRMKRNIDSHAKDWDFLVVLYHGGNEYYPFPSPDLRDRCRFLVDCGAHVVLCQHTHIIGCHEFYREGYILYGQGNFLFDMPNRPAWWYRGLLVQLKIADEGSFKVELLPVTQSPDEPGVELLDARGKKEELDALKERSERFLEPDFLEQSWLEFCKKYENYYLGLALGFPKILRRLNRWGWLLKLYPEDVVLGLGNLYRCDAHRNVIVTLLNRKFRDIQEKDVL